MSSGDEISPVCACPADDGPADTGRAAGSVTSCSGPTETSEGAASSDDGLSEGTDEDGEARLGQACSIGGYRKRFSHDKHNARTSAARSLECPFSPSVPAEFRAEVCPCPNTTEKSKTCAKSLCTFSFFFGGGTSFLWDHSVVLATPYDQWMTNANSCVSRYNVIGWLFFSCTLRFQEGHLPHTRSLTKAFTLGRTKNGRLSIREKKEARFEPRFMVCPKTEAMHFERQAASARRAAMLKAERR